MDNTPNHLKSWVDGNFYPSPEDQMPKVIENWIWFDGQPDINSPDDIRWVEGELPDIRLVRPNTWVLAFCVVHITQEEYERSLNFNVNGMPQPYPHPDTINGTFSGIKPLMVWGNYLNRARWCDTGSHPFGHLEKVKYYAWIHR